MRGVENRDRFLVDEMLHHLGVLAAVVSGGRERFRGPEGVEARYAAEHAAELIAEAAPKTSRIFRSENPSLPISLLRGLRNVVAHRYDLGGQAVDTGELWRFASEVAPRLERDLRKVRFPRSERQRHG